jgi:Lrp/AsnC family leucine-responsive transcriptional regulator
MIMPYSLDEIDVAVLNSLMEDGRKSFRQISREIKISTPTVKFRYQRLVNIGLIKSVVPIIDTAKIGKKDTEKLAHCHCETDVPNINLTNNMTVLINCDLCQRPVGEKPPVLKIGDYERFFCCDSCKSIFKEKYKGRIESIVDKFQNKVKSKSLKVAISTGSFFAVGGICLDHGIQHLAHSAQFLL